jgi:hypothetical protein
MGKRIWTAPLVLALGILGGCSKSRSPQGAGPAIGYNTTAPANNPEPVAPPAPDTAANSSATPLPPESAPPPAGGPVAPSYVPPSATNPAAPAPPARAQIEIPRGAHLRVRLDQEIDTRRNRSGDGFSATLYEPVYNHGVAVLPVGTRFRGHLTASAPSRRLRGRAVLGLTLDSFHYQGREYRIDTSSDYRQSRSHKKRNLGFIAGGSGFGAVVGAIAGGGAGAAIGAAAGGGAGVAGAVITGKKQVTLRAEAPMIFTLRKPVVI